jgi:hypothetical protein
VFTDLFEIFGGLTISDSRTSNPEVEAMAKATLDSFSRMRFPDLLLAMPDLSRQILFGRDRDSRDSNNRISAENSHEKISYAKRVSREIKSNINRYGAQLMPTFLAITNGETGVAEQARDRLLALLVGRPNLKQDLPTVYIGSAIYAAIDHKHRQFDDGDLFDHDHAIAALPYCDAFFTEKKLGTLLTEMPAQLDKEYDCRVLWKSDQVLAELNTFANDG